MNIFTERGVAWRLWWCLVGCTTPSECSRKLVIRCPLSPRRSLRRGAAAFDKIPHCAGEGSIVDDIKKPASTVLAALAIGSRERALLVHISEDRIRVSGAC